MPILKKIAPLFDGWDEAMVWSCLQGCMGYTLADNDEHPTAAQIVVGDFCFLAGTPCRNLVEQANASLLIPRTEDWRPLIESVWGNRVELTQRYAIKKEPQVFDVPKLTRFVEELSPGYTLSPIDERIYAAVMREDWSRDLCSQFEDSADYARRGLGFVALYQGYPVAGASSYAVYRGGIEIEIDTKEEFRRQGLATACGARLILECLKRGLYPSWDAHDLRSVALAEKLGYHRGQPYPVYSKRK